MTFKSFLPLIILIALTSCTHKERKGLAPDQRNYDGSKTENFHDGLAQPSDAIYIFESNIHYAISKQLTFLCDSVFGKGFVSQDQINEIKSLLKNELRNYKQPNPEIQIDSKNIETKLTQNENGYSSLRYKLNDLTTLSPLKLNPKNLMTYDCTTPDLELNANGYHIKFRITILMSNELQRSGIYTVLDRLNQDASPYYKYTGECRIRISLETQDVDGRIEYYFNDLKHDCDHYTQSQYLDSDGVIYI